MTPHTRIGELRIVVIDDDPFIRDLILQMLQGVGIANCRGYEDAAEALASDISETNVFICDLNMPGMDGVTLLRHLAERQYGGQVILLSGEDERLLYMAEELAIEHHLRVLGTLHKSAGAGAIVGLLERAMRPDPANPGKPHAAAATVTQDELNLAIAERTLEVWFQPKVGATSGSLTGAEALVRWRHPRRGMISPMEFVTLAEECGAIGALTDLVLEKAIAQAGLWHAAYPELRIAINLSVDTLPRLDLVDRILGLARNAGIPSKNLIFEVTESRILKEPKLALETLGRLSMKGFGLAIDDFGTGHSSLSQLHRIPFTEMKIDRQFVNGASHDITARHILESGAALGKKLGMSIVAEGVESESDLAVVKAAGVDIIQGFIVSPPVPAHEFERRFLANTADAML